MLDRALHQFYFSSNFKNYFLRLNNPLTKTITSHTGARPSVQQNCTIPDNKPWIYTAIYQIQ